MNIHLTHRKQEVEARPVSRTIDGQQPLLQKVILESDHLGESGVVHLSPDQVLYVHSRLAVIAAAFLHGHTEHLQHLGTARLPEDAEQRMRKCGARVWMISREDETLPEVLEQVVVASNHPDGAGVIRLSPEQVPDLYSRLTQITLAYLHENTWGGEDARVQ